VTDPFGWEATKDEKDKDPDPWENYSFYYNGKQRVGTKSYYLWKEKLPGVKEVVTSNGGTYTAGKVKVEVQPDTFISPVTLNVSYAPSTKLTDSTWSVGPVIEITAKNIAGDLITVLTKPVKLIWFPFRDTELARFKIGSFYLYSSKDANNWTKETEVNPFNPGEITAAASHFTYFAIMGERKDMIPPVTNVQLNGAKGQGNWFRSDVEMKLNATDSADIDPSGVKYTYYKINDGEWIPYKDPVVLTEEKHYDISYYSSDNDGNIGDVKSVEFDIDKTSPEAEISYDLKTFDTLVTGKDNLSSTSLQIDKSKPLQPKYVITDQAGNRIILNTGKIKVDKQVALTIKNIQYNFDPVKNLEDNVYFTFIATDKSNAIKQIDQYYTLKGDKRIFTNYLNKDDVTKIYTKSVGSAYVKEEKPGIVLLQLETENGKLNYRY
jgi:hypothetical protein